MIVVSVVPDESMIVPGFERYTMQCLGCGETEERFLFKASMSRQAETAVQAAAVVAEQANPPEPVPMARAWLRAIEKLRGHETALTEERAEAQKADRVTEFYREWEELIPAAQRPHRLRQPPKPASRARSMARLTDRLTLEGTQPNAWEHATAKLRARQHRG
ncbi:MAG: hypothetical protein ACJ8F3_08215 [Xanthobacteraceae bacterium]